MCTVSSRCTSRSSLTCSRWGHSTTCSCCGWRAGRSRASPLTLWGDGYAENLSRRQICIGGIAIGRHGLCICKMRWRQGRRPRHGGASTEQGVAKRQCLCTAVGEGSIVVHQVKNALKVFKQESTHVLCSERCTAHCGPSTRAWNSHQLPGAHDDYGICHLHPLCMDETDRKLVHASLHVCAYHVATRETEAPRELA